MSITATTAISGGNITDDGGASITARGVCWSTTSNPTFSDSHTSDGTGTGIFTSNLTGLSRNKKYFVRAYATNSSGTAYGQEESFTTLDVPSLTGSTFTLVSIRFQPVPGNVDFGASCGPPSILYNGVETLFFNSENSCIESVYDTTKLIRTIVFSYSIGDFYPDSLCYCTNRINCTNAYGHQHPEGFGQKIPPGYDLKLGEVVPTRISLDGSTIYRIMTGDRVYKKQ